MLSLIGDIIGYVTLIIAGATLIGLAIPILINIWIDIIKDWKALFNSCKRGESNK